MRYFIIALFFLPFLSTGVNAQTEVPAAVLAAFTAKFPDAADVSWEQEDANSYEAEFTMNGLEMSALFDQAGEWQETETPIETQSLPDAVLKTIAKQFSGYNIEEAEQIENAQGIVSYEVELEEGNQSVEVLFSADGQVVKQMAEDEEDANESDDD